MATVIVQQQHTLRHSTPPPSSMTSSLVTNSRSSPIPNKHIPVCPTGPAPFDLSDSDWSPSLPEGCSQVSSLLQSAHMRYKRISEPPSPIVYSLDADQLAEAMKHLSSQPLPDPSYMFPWLHGLHPDNHMQLNFFSSRRKIQRKPPKNWRGLTIVKLGGELDTYRLKGAVAPEDVLSPQGCFLNPDPPQAFSVRNFQIQGAKLAALSDIVVYGEPDCCKEELLLLAQAFAVAQEQWRYKHDPAQDLGWYNTFILTTPFPQIEQKHPEIVGNDFRGIRPGEMWDFSYWERLEMSIMSEVSEISKNVWLGPTPHWLGNTADRTLPKDCEYDLIIDAYDMAQIPGPRSLAMIDKKIEEIGPQRMEFPSSGVLYLKSGNNRETEDIINTVRWIHYLANPEAELMDQGNDAAMKSTKKPRKVLIHCNDGYTESSFLAVVYFMFAENLRVDDAMIKLHCEKQRNFFLYQTDRMVLSHIQPRLLMECPVPFRILNYLYLGNLNHANNPEMLWKLGIRRVLSMGECITWNPEQRVRWGEDNLLHISIQDNGIDELCHEYNRCLDFIQQGKAEGTATLVHCRVGVSRSASICIAKVMQEYDISFPRAYCFVRARRLNVIIQPNLRFVYELLQWEEYLNKKKGNPILRDLEWTYVCREIALLNKPYSRR
ncbi:hypothetical protein N7470_008427 [Penicillium chermesinum]|nr:hypothetical protein N7470_008427 [Penicillium chermesinum]